jgi:hypothetical protein
VDIRALAAEAHRLIDEECDYPRAFEIALQIARVRRDSFLAADLFERTAIDLSVKPRLAKALRGPLAGSPIATYLRRAEDQLDPAENVDLWIRSFPSDADAWIQRAVISAGRTWFGEREALERAATFFVFGPYLERLVQASGGQERFVAEQYAPLHERRPKQRETLIDLLSLDVYNEAELKRLQDKYPDDVRFVLREAKKHRLPAKEELLTKLSAFAETDAAAARAHLSFVAYDSDFAARDAKFRLLFAKYWALFPSRHLADVTGGPTSLVELEAAKRGLERFPRCASLRLGLAKAKLWEGRLEDALAEVEEIWKLREPESQDLTALGRSLDADRIEAIADKLARRFPKNDLLASSAPFLTARSTSYGRDQSREKSVLQLMVQRGHAGGALAIAASPTEPIYATTGRDGLKLWDETSGRLLAEAPGDLSSPVFSHDGRLLAAAGPEQRLLVFHPHERRVENALSGDGESSTTRQLRFFGKGERLLVFGGSADVSEWNARTLAAGGALSVKTAPSDSLATADVEIFGAVEGEQINIYKNTKRLGSISWQAAGTQLALSPKGDLLCASQTGTSGSLACFTVRDRKQLFHRRLRSQPKKLAFTRDGKALIAGEDNGLTVRDPRSGKVLRRYARGRFIADLSISGSGRYLHFVDVSGNVAAIDLVRGELKTSPDLPRAFVDPSQDARGLRAKDTLWTVIDGRIHAWDLEEGTRSVSFPGDTIAYASNEELLARSYYDRVEVHKGDELRAYFTAPRWVRTLAFDPRGRLALFDENSIGFRELGSDAAITIPMQGAGERNLFSADGTRLLSTGINFAAYVDLEQQKTIWNTYTSPFVRPLFVSKEIAVLANTSLRILSLRSPTEGSELGAVRASSPVEAVQISGRTITLLSQAENVVTNTNLGAWTIVAKKVPSSSEPKLLQREDGAFTFGNSTLFAFGEKDWAVVDEQNRFDASNGGNIDQLHFVLGLEPIALSQLKERFYDPRLLAKHAGTIDEPLRDVTGFDQIALHPAIETKQVGAKVRIRLKNRGGGIGRVQVLVNGKELTADARPKNFNSEQKSAELTVDVSKAATYRSPKDEIRVIVWDARGHLSSRGGSVLFEAPAEKEVVPPHFYAIIAGVSTYAKSTLNLSFAAKDAIVMADAVKRAGDRLFSPERVHVALFASGSENAPTKVNLKGAFDALKTTQPEDVVFVYFAGHGLALTGGHGEYAFLTADAESADPATYVDAAIREAHAVTDEDLTAWIKQIPALKQVMALDTCAAGAAGRLTDSRELTGSQIRAIERLKDRTGFHVLMGSPANAKSYEASTFGQGLLTYALLQGMSGAALRSGEYVDVSGLFQYAADRVPELARSLGRTQRPSIAAPRGTSFDIGRMLAEDRQSIVLPSPKPMLVQPALLNADDIDALGLSKLLREAMREETNADRPRFIYVDVAADELAPAFAPSGRYTVSGNEVRIRIRLARDAQVQGELEVSGSLQDRAKLGLLLRDALAEKLRSIQ